MTSSCQKHNGTQIVPKKGDPFRDKALSTKQVKQVYEFMPPIEKACLLLHFTTRMRIGELIEVKESDLEGKAINLKGTYTKNGREQDVVMTQECLSYLEDIWVTAKGRLPKNIAIPEYRINQPIKNPGETGRDKKLDDDRIIPAEKSTIYEILMRGFKRAGFGDK